MGGLPHGLDKGRRAITRGYRQVVVGNSFPLPRTCPARCVGPTGLRQGKIAQRKNGYTPR